MQYIIFGVEENWIKQITLENIICKSDSCAQLIILTFHSIYLYISKLTPFIGNRIELSTKSIAIMEKKSLEQHESKRSFEYIKYSDSNNWSS